MDASLLSHTNQIVNVQVKNANNFVDKIVFEASVHNKNHCAHAVTMIKRPQKGVKQDVCGWLLWGIRWPFFRWKFID